MVTSYYSSALNHDADMCYLDAMSCGIELLSSNVEIPLKKTKYEIFSLKRLNSKKYGLAGRDFFTF
jgi:hypothetical protein